MMHVAKYPHLPGTEEEIELQQGDQISNKEEIGNGWSFGHNNTSGRTGVFPTNYVEDKRLSRPKSILDVFSVRPSCPPERPELPDSSVEKYKSLQRTTPSQQQTGMKQASSMEILNEVGKQVFMSKRGEHFTKKAIAGIISGLIIGLLLIIVCHYVFLYPLEDAAFIALGSSAIISLGLAFSVHCRCIIVLMLPSLATGKGRVVFLSIISGLLLNGPVVNIKYNSNVATESFACFSDLAYNKSLLLRERLLDGVQSIGQQLKENAANVKSVARELQKAEDVLGKALSESKKYGRDVEKAYQRCNNIADATKCTTAVNSRCRDVVKSISTGGGVITDIGDFFNSLGKRSTRRRLSHSITDLLTRLKIEKPIWNPSNTAMNHLSVHKRLLPADKICDPIDDICDVITLTGEACNTLGTPIKYIVKTQDELQKALDFLQNLYSFEVDASDTISGGANKSTNMTYVKEKIMEEFDEKTGNFVQAISIVNRILSFSILFLVLQSYLYLRRFLARDNFDNIYITKKFKAVDKKRKEQGKTTILPLKKKEHKKYIVTSSCMMAPAERTKLFTGAVMVSLHFVIAVLIIFFDYTLYFILDLINRHARFKFEISGKTDIKFEIKGSGPVSQALQLIFKDVQYSDDYTNDYDTTVCLPNPNEPNLNEVWIFIVLYLFAFAFVFLESYGMRLRRKIAAFYYPEQDQARTIYLYNYILQSRVGLKKRLLRLIRLNRKEQNTHQTFNVANWLAVKFPGFWKIHSLFGRQKRFCLSCSQAEEKGFYVCNTPGCKGIYCQECFVEIERQCSLCNESVTVEESDRVSTINHDFLIKK